MRVGMTHGGRGQNAAKSLKIWLGREDSNLRMGELLAAAPQVVLAGDYNVMPTELDVYKPERWVDDALFRPEVRAATS